jgi:tetratricopeptide (TPR) repeat protein
LEQDRIGRAFSYIGLANVALARFRDARAPTEQLDPHIERAIAGYEHALALLPDDHHHYRADAHLGLGNVYYEVGDVRGALDHYQLSVQHEEARGNTYGAGRTRYNIAVLLGDNGRPDDALLYARAALANFQEVGAGADALATQAQALIEELERDLATPPS